MMGSETMRPVRYRVKKPKKEMKTLDKVLIILASFLFVFIVTTVIIYTYNGWQYDTLITMVMGGSGIEVMSTALITISKIRKCDEDATNSSDDISYRTDV